MDRLFSHLKMKFQTSENCYSDPRFISEPTEKVTAAPNIEAGMVCAYIRLE